MSAAPPVPVRYKQVSVPDWLAALAHPGHQLQFTRGGLASVGSDWGAPSRVMVEHLFYLVVEHGFQVTLGGRPHQIRPGDFLWIKPQTEHALSLPPQAVGCSMFWLRVRLEQVERHLELLPGDEPIMVTDAWSMRPMFEKLIEELSQRHAYRDQLLRSMMVAICCQALRAPEAEVRLEHQLTTTQRRLLAALVSEHPQQRWSPADLASEMGLSHDYFSRVFRRTYGIPPRRWLLQERIRYAARQLGSAQTTITQLAQSLGYQDLFLFSRQFKEVMGHSPSTYRRGLDPSR
jgi:AraC-like DNA-binding protein